VRPPASNTGTGAMEITADANATSKGRPVPWLPSTMRASASDGMTSAGATIRMTRALHDGGTAAEQETWMASGRRAQISCRSSGLVEWVTQTLVMAGTASKISRAWSGVTQRGETEWSTTPMRSAPAASARRASPGVVIPQIFTRIRIPPVLLPGPVPP
jgi:hypothetical protein